MATSESDDFESADEEMSAQRAPRYQQSRAKKYVSIGSDSDDDVDFIPVQNHAPVKKHSKQKSASQRKHNSSTGQADAKPESKQMEKKKVTDKSEKNQGEPSKVNKELNQEKSESSNSSKSASSKRERPQRQRKPKEIQPLGAVKLGATKTDKLPDVRASTFDEVRGDTVVKGEQPPLTQECWEECDEKNLREELEIASKQSKVEKNCEIESPKDVPEELKSNLKFKDLFKPDGWEALNEDVVLPDDLSDDKYQPVLDKLAKSVTVEQESPNDGWGGWGSWGVSSLLNTASVGVSTLTSHVNQGLTYLEESLGIPNPEDLTLEENPEKEKLEKSEMEKIEPEKVELEKPELKNSEKDSQSQYLSSFGFGSFISSMSSITKLVETTSTKVISGGLDTLETLGKKTMEVLQEGDPGLKKKRAFFLNEADKPILSHILREAKEKADLEEKSIEEKELSRKVHFESLFDDYQGLVHLEALEMLSKQCNMKIQQQLMNLDSSDLTSMQETLDEVKDLCDLGDEDEDEDEEQEKKDLTKELEEATKDLGISVTYNKLVDSWNAMNSEVPTELKESSHREIFQKAISALAQFTAYSVERFHKTAELLLIKERRSTVNEADSLVQLTKTLSSQIGVIANLYNDRLREFKENAYKSEVTSSITTISLEATNASSYVEEAFRLLIPILQVGAI
ncbi:protein FAM114A2 isoform X2 [Copidosoma floridanum]|uniref:protein FAM114A2 isoform X2 n=1 Tax=Copidosoma floridanum TaxID=29053 RepID=UPI000C6F966D|nr:protein FAM114A2 isoform X2 [Copidosoma floridanum]